MMSSHTLEEIVSIAADIRPGDEILTGSGHAVSWERVARVSRRGDGVTRFVTRSATLRRNDTAGVFIRRSVTA